MQYEHFTDEHKRRYLVDRIQRAEEQHYWNSIGLKASADQEEQRNLRRGNADLERALDVLRAELATLPDELTPDENGDDGTP